MKRLIKHTFTLALCALGMAAMAQTTTAPTDAKTELLWLGQAGFRIKSPGGKSIVIDPWLTGGPKTPTAIKTDIGTLGKVDLLLVTHAHVDHLLDHIEFTQKRGAALGRRGIQQAEAVAAAQQQTGEPEQTHMPTWARFASASRSRKVGVGSRRSGM